MPIYEYQCNACGKVNEVMQKFGADAPAACDSCSGGPMTKLLSRTGFILKGSGWYVTDFRGGNNKPATGAASGGGSSESSGGATSDSSTSETKTETKAAGGCASGCSHNH